MEKITLKIRTTKANGDIRLRFRLKDGRAIDLTHPSQIVASLKDLEKFGIDGEPRKQVTIYNVELRRQIAEEKAAMHAAYIAMRNASLPPYKGELFERYVMHTKHPEISLQGDRCDILARYDRYLVEGQRDGVFGRGRVAAYKVTGGILKRFLAVNNLQDILPGQFDADVLMRFREFVENECNYVEQWRQLYVNMRERDIPTEKRGQNTIAIKMRMLQAFFAELESKGEIERSPFAKLGKDRKHKTLRERYNDPIYLQADEIQAIIAAAVPEDMQECKDAFLLQCAIGCRMGDYKAMTMANFAVDKDGVPYVHYLPQKTTEGAADFAEIETPIVRFAFDIIKQYNFDFKVLRNVSGHDGYNKRIKELLQLCGISRECAEFDPESGTNIYKPLHEFGSSKLARKTHVDLLNKVQVNQYAAGLHKEGSAAVNHYTKLERKDRFILLCAAFGQPLYKVNADLEIIK